MPKLVKDGKVIDDNYRIVESDNALTKLDQETLYLLPVDLWLENLATNTLKQACGVWLDSDQPPALLGTSLQQAEVIAINFPAFTDGRSFSYARELRDTLKFSGEIRAIGNYIRDQMYYLKRCGVNSFSFNETSAAEKALNSLNDFSDNYQASADQTIPAFKRRA